MSVSHGVELLSRLMIRSRSPIMSTRIIARMSFSVLSAARRLDVVAAAVGVVGPLPLADGFLAVEEQQLDRHGVGPRLEHARQLDQERRARPAVVGADERGTRGTASCRSGRR